MRIAILPAIFNHSLSYQENVCARIFSDAGHTVEIFTSWHGVDDEAATAVADSSGKAIVHRTKKVWTFRKTAIPRDPKIIQKLQGFRPEVAFVMAPLHGLGFYWMKHLPPECKIISWFSDIPFHREKSAFRTWFKARWAREVFKKSHKIIASTPETATLLQEWGGRAILPKLKTLGLTYEPDTLSSKTPLPPLVTEWAVRFDKKIAIITKVIEHKQLHLFFPHLETFLKTRPDVGLIIAGLIDNESSRQLRSVVESSPVSSQVLLHSPIDSHQIGDVLRMSKASIWNSVSIGIYHSLACGCPTLNWTGKGYAHHIVKDGENGFWYDSWSELPITLEKALTHPWDKDNISKSISFADATKSLPALLAEVTEKKL